MVSSIQKKIYFVSKSTISSIKNNLPNIFVVIIDNFHKYRFNVPDYHKVSK